MVFSNEFNSTAISKASYDTDDSTLAITFRDKNGGGRTYTYFDVPFGVYKELTEASSAGRYVNQNIVGAGYDYNMNTQEPQVFRLGMNVRDL